MKPSHLFRSFTLIILLAGQEWNCQPCSHAGAAAPSEEPPPINLLLSEAAKLTGATNENVINDWLRALVVTGHEREALGWARQIPDSGLQSHALRTMTETLLRAGKRDEALEAAEAAYVAAQCIKPAVPLSYVTGDRRPHARADELCKLAEILGQYGEVEKARQLTAEAFDDALRMEDLQRRSANLSQAVLQLARLGQPDEALAALRRIEEPVIRSHVMCSALGELVAARAHEQALREFHHIADERYRFPTLQATVCWLLKSGKQDEALKVTRAITDLSEQVAVMRYAATALYKAGPSEPAGTILDEALVVARQLTDQEERGGALADIASVLANFGRLAEARKLFSESCQLTNEQATLGQHSEAQHDIFERLLAAGQDEEALALARRCDEPYARANDLCSVIESFIQTRQPKRARRIVAEVLAGTRQIEDEGLQLLLLQRLIAALNESPLARELKQATDAAISLLLKYERSSANSQLCWGILQTLAISGRTAEALRFAARVSDSEARSFVLLHAAGALAKAGKKSDTQKLLAAALDAVRQINRPMLRELQLTSLARALIENGQIEEALNLARTDATGVYRSQCLYFVADHFARSSRAINRLDRWLSVLREIEHEHDRSAAILSALEMMIRADRFDDWLILASGIECKDTRAQLLCSTTEQLIKSNLKTEAKQVAEEALRVLQQLDPGYTHSRICAEFGVKLAAWHYYQLAMEIAYLCTEPDDKLAVFTAILRNAYVKR